MNIDQLVEQHYEQLNEADIFIWQYIVHNKNKCQKMSIKHLAEACNCSSANIIRFAKKLGLDGYSELKIHIKWSLENIPEFEMDTLSNTVADIHKTLQKLEVLDMTDILKKIHNANRIFMFVTGEVQNLTAQELKRKCSYINLHIHIVEDNDEMGVLVNTLLPNDLFIIISFEGNNATAIKWAKYLMQHHIGVIGIAKDTHNLLKKHCDAFIGFSANKFNTGLSYVPFTCTSHLYIITDILLIKLLEYIKDSE